MNRLYSAETLELPLTRVIDSSVVFEGVAHRIDTIYVLSTELYIQSIIDGHFAQHITPRRERDSNPRNILKFFCLSILKCHLKA